MRFLVRVVKNEEEGTYSVSAPALKGCWSQGDTREEALENIKIAIEEYLASFEPDATADQVYVTVGKVA